MKVTQLETLFCDAGWRPWIFLKATTDDGAVAWAEITDSQGVSPAPSRRSTGTSTVPRGRAPAP